MGLNISLFVHGVPMGQKIWGPKRDDERYLSSFYGPKWDIPEVMKVDVMNIGGTAQCYYSFIKGRNVCDSQGRAGSYFALTIKINAFYADVQNMYNILKAVYDKMCVGLCVQEGNGAIKYLLSDFQSIDGKLKEIETHLINYISEFSIGSDIVSLAGFAANGQSASQVNLFECNRYVATERVKNSGRLMVSPCFPSSETAKMIAQSKAETLAVKQQAQEREQHLKQTHQEEISRLSQQHNDALNEKEKQHHSVLEKQKTDYENRLAAYKDVDSKIEDLERRIRQKDNEISDWKRQCENRDKENRQLRQRLASLQDTPSSPNLSMAEPYAPEFHKRKPNWMLIGLASIAGILLLLLAWFGFSLCKSWFNKATGQNDLYVQDNDTTKSDSIEDTTTLKLNCPDVNVDTIEKKHIENTIVE